jgi:hypothetical protein
MEEYFIIIETVKEDFSNKTYDRLVSDNEGDLIKFRTIIDVKDYIFHANIKSAIIFKRASIQINTNVYDPTKK